MKKVRSFVLPGIVALSLASMGGTYALTSGPEIQVNPGTIQFGDVKVGSVSPAETIVISNVGGSPLVISKILKRGRDILDFHVVSTTCNFSGTTLNPGDSCEINVSFQPTSVGKKKGLFKILSNADNETTSYAYLRGNGVAPQAEINPTSIDFGAVYMPGDSANQTVTVSNTGLTPLEISNVVLRGVDSANFRILSENCSNSSVNPGDSCTIELDFKPVTIGKVKAALKIITNDTDNPKLYTHITGIGRNADEPDISSNVTTQDYGTIETGMCYPATITITNAGGTTPVGLTIDKVLLRGRDASEFTMTDNCTGVTLGSGDTCTVDVEACPTGEGFKKAVVKIRSNDPDENPYIIKLKAEVINIGENIEE